MAGRLVCIEGIDGAGKNTQSRMLSQHLEEIGVRSVIYSYPDYKTRYGKIIREFLDKKIELNIEELFFLQILDKQKDSERAKSDIEKGKIVIMDRYVHSALAYQSAGGFDYNNAKIIANLSGLLKPDIVFYIDVPVEVSIGRKSKQTGGNLDRFERAGAYLNKVREVYTKMYKERFGCENWVWIDGRKAVGVVHGEIFLEVSKLLDSLEKREKHG